MSDMSFTWKGVSSDTHGVVVRTLPPIYTPQPRDEVLTVPGRDGSLHRQDGTYEEQLLMIEGYLPYEQGVHVAPIETISEWLSGTGELVLSDRPDKAYHGRIIEGVAFSQWVPGYMDRLFSVSFWCDPFKYDVGQRDIPLYASGQTMVNPTGIKALPIITVQGSGQVVLRVNSTSVTLSNVSGAIVIDCDAKVAYSQGSSTPVGITLNDERFPFLGSGANVISWSGSVSMVTVRPNWRYL